MKNIVDLLISGGYKRIVLNSSDLFDITSVQIMQELMDKKQSFRVLYTEEYDEWYIKLTDNETDDEIDWK